MHVLPQRNSNCRFIPDSGHHQHGGWEGFGCRGPVGLTRLERLSCFTRRRLRRKGQNCPHLPMRLFPAACRADIALVELCRNSVVARCPGAHDLLNDRANMAANPASHWPSERLCRVLQPRLCAGRIQVREARPLIAQTRLTGPKIPHAGPGDRSGLESNQTG